MSSSCCSSATSLSNFERFLQSVTPVVPSTTISQGCINDLNSPWHPVGNKEEVEYFTLKDFWDCYDEWSAYGAGTNVMLESGESVMQFFVPYLSSIHIYTNKSVATSRKEDGEVAEFESDSWSDDSGSDNFSRSLSENSSKAWEDVVSEDSSCDQENSWTDRERLGYPYLNYIETSSPYQRVPLAQKISELARSHPAINTLRSVDLSPASWMAVAWYPIYSIPSLKNEKGLETCFLTYHTLSSSFQDNAKEYEDIDLGKEIIRCGWERKCLKSRKSGSIGVSPFGVATYKMCDDIWVNSKSCDQERLSFLHNAAESWLKQLNVHHHDFNFFAFHSSSF